MQKYESLFNFLFLFAWYEKKVANSNLHLTRQLNKTVMRKICIKNDKMFQSSNAETLIKFLRCPIFVRNVEKYKVCRSLSATESEYDFYYQLTE